MQNNNDKMGNRIHTVTTLTREIKVLLERSFPMVWINGEISNLSRPSSGHLYFTLKDKSAQISAVMFRGQNMRLKFSLENGMNVTGFGRVSLYEPRGTYQLIFEYLEPKGAGALQLAFEQLKNRLAAEGLFDSVHKKKIPFLPRRISVVTSPSGAVIHDILTVVTRRFDTLVIEIVPVKVQGDEAAGEIVSALDFLNRRATSDVVILARGGGSLEDFMAFNSEPVARAIFASGIPVVSAVGHETDYTIADFVSDLRAPTPSAAAELVVPEKEALEKRNRELLFYLTSAALGCVEGFRERCAALSARLVDPRKRIQDLMLLNDDLRERLARAVTVILTHRRDHLRWRHEKLLLCSPAGPIDHLKKGVDRKKSALFSAMNRVISEKRSKLKELTGRLHALNPGAILERGYSITRRCSDSLILTDANLVGPEEDVEVILARGSMTCRVKGIKTDGKKNI